MKSYGNKCYLAIPAICEWDVLISDPKRKVNVFNEYFVSQATLTILLKFPFYLCGHQTLYLQSQRTNRWFTFYLQFTLQKHVVVMA